MELHSSSGLFCCNCIEHQVLYVILQILAVLIGEKHFTVVSHHLDCCSCLPTLFDCQTNTLTVTRKQSKASEKTLKHKLSH